MPEYVCPAVDILKAIQQGAAPFQIAKMSFPKEIGVNEPNAGVIILTGSSKVAVSVHAQ